ncbi:MAG: hypothetical protein Q8L15_01305 [Methylobacter sp.]|nr:hypothetical protein [Methylobacter sp.]
MTDYRRVYIPGAMWSFSATASCVALPPASMQLMVNLAERRNNHLLVEKTDLLPVKHGWVWRVIDCWFHLSFHKFVELGYLFIYMGMFGGV